MAYKVSVKWGKQKFDDIELDTTQPPLLFKTVLFSLTGVPPERQTVMTKSGMLKDDTDWAKLNIKDGYTFMLMGTADPVPVAPAKPTVFVEDLPDAQKDAGTAAPPGLENLGNTCYMNATIQVLRAIPELDNALAKLPPVRSAEPVVAVTDGVRQLLSDLKSSNGTVTPFVFLSLLRAAHPQFAQTQNGRPMQQDAEECWSQIVTNLGQRLKEPTGTSFVDTFFGIHFAQTWKNTENADEPPTVTADVQTKLQCHISQNVNYLYQGVAEALKEQVEKHSPTLNRTAVYEKISKISRLPSYLMVNFVRFFWRRDTNKKAKILRRVKFPVVLDMFDFCTDDLKAQLEPQRAKFRAFDEKQAELRAFEKRKKHRGDDDAGTSAAAPMAADGPSGSAAAGGSDNQGDDAERAALTGYDLSKLEPVSGENRSGLYELVAVLTHIGRSSDSGHYMAWVRAEGDNWWKFDDDTVTPVKTEEILKLDGGGDWHMAYMCLYRERTLPADFKA